MKKRVASKSQSRRRPRGNRLKPLLAVAVICERVLQEEQVSSIIRIVDVFNLTGESKTLKPGVIEFTIYLLFKSDKARGTRTVKVDVISPSSETRQVFTGHGEFKGGGQGISFTVKGMFGVKETGLYWFEVFVNKDLMTRIPLRIEYRQAIVAQQDRR